MPTPFSEDDRAFIRSILSRPGDRACRLIYADWLDERNDPRAEFIRIQIRRDDPNLNRPERDAVDAHLQGLTSSLDADWVAILDRPPIENCTGRFAFECPKKWENLTATDEPEIRHCDGCGKDVYYCGTLTLARHHARLNRCVAVSLRVPRKTGDIAPRPREPEMRTTVGRLIQPTPEPKSARRSWWKFW